MLERCNAKHLSEDGDLLPGAGVATTMWCTHLLWTGFCNCIVSTLLHAWPIVRLIPLHDNLLH